MGPVREPRARTRTKALRLPATALSPRPAGISQRHRRGDNASLF